VKKVNIFNDFNGAIKQKRETVRVEDTKLNERTKYAWIVIQGKYLLLFLHFDRRRISSDVGIDLHLLLNRK